jgi:hypothetical protein
MTGGLPAQAGLTALANPMAQQLQSMGRDDDTMLVHMTPEEVNSLQGLAMAAGGSLTINPQTGLPEASFLKKLLPMIAGIGLNFVLPGSGIVASLGGKAATAGLLTGAASTAITGDLSKGLMAGLSAFGGASLAGGAEAAFGAKAAGAKTSAAGVSPGGATPPIAPSGPAFTVPAAGGPMPLDALQATLPAQTAAAKASGTLGQFGQGFAETARGGMTGLAGKAAPYAAGMGVLNTVSEATAPQMPRYNPEDEEGGFDYRGPYMPQPRVMRPTLTGPGGRGEINFFEDANPFPGYLPAPGFAEGGEAKKEERPSWMPEWMQGYKGTYEIIRDSVDRGGRVSPLVREVLTPEQKAQIDADNAIISEHIRLVKRSQAGGLSPEERSAYNAISENLDDAKNRINYINNANARQNEATRAKYGVASYTLSEAEPTPTQPTGGLGATAPAQSSATSPAITPPTSTITPGGVTPGGGGGVTLSDRVLSPGATQSGAGLEVLQGAYTPKFTEKADFTSPANAPLTLGSQMSAALPALTQRYSTSPGAITASRGYAGGSPSERIRAFAAANTAAAAPSTPGAPTPGGEFNFGLAASRNPRTPGTPGTPDRADDVGMLNPYLNRDFTNPYFADFWNGFSVPFAKGGEVRTDDGGEVHIDDGGFILSAREAAELGKGDPLAAIKAVAPFGGIPLIGPGNGTSDSIPARIGGTQKARVASGEIYFPFDAVKRIGGGDHSKGTKKLYALMRKAEQSRKNTPRGEDGPDLMRGLA